MAANILQPGATTQQIVCAASADGSVLVRRTEPLGAHARRVTEPLEHWANVAPGRAFMAERAGDGWRMVTYREALTAARAIGQALLDRDLSTQHPVLILSGNSIAHALLALGCLHVGIPFVPISTAYSLLSADFARLRDIVDLVRPGLVFAEDGSAYAAAIDVCIAPETELVVARGNPGRHATLFDTLLATIPGAAVDVAAGKVGPDSVAKLLFTSGSTGFPKGVIHTHRMWCSTIAMFAAVHPIGGEKAPVLVDWLPWSHVFGGSVSFGMVLFNGGTFYIDDGKPLPGQFEKTARNLREIASTFHTSVPRGYEELLRALRGDDALRRSFFSQVQFLQYSGAALPHSVFDGFAELARATIGHVVPWLAALGSTEAGLITARLGASPNDIGLPACGVDLKLVPVDGKWEARVKSPSVTPGYWRRHDLTEDAFDAQGFLRTGDAVAWIEPGRPEAGLRYDGRMAEDFKLVTGTWVRVGMVREHLMKHLAAELRDVVIVGENREYIAVLGIPTDARGASDPDVHERLRSKLAALARDAGGSAQRVLRFAFLTAPLSIDRGELTDKGAISQRTILRRYVDVIDTLYADPPGDHVICVDPSNHDSAA
ncbi:feruloyl-CoA synthase [Bradyrhizobium sp. HKCCYLS1011]|uniref:feruloyl-CoA synthase n=1 Tax=Bradyrhizobium sp. HKCCYLS1011 TaxID=3420733 RepID=UPI003EBB5BD5